MILFINNQSNYVFDSRPGLCIAPDSPHAAAEINISDDINNKLRAIVCGGDSSVGSLNQIVPRNRNNSTTLTTTPTTSTSRSSSLSSLSTNDQQDNKIFDLENICDNPDAIQLVFKSTLSDEKEIEWKTYLIDGNNLYVDIPSNHLGDGTRDSFVSLLEFAEDKLNCERVFVVINKSRTDRSSLMNVFRFFGFKPVAPGNKYAPQNDDLIAMVYEIE